MYRDIKITTTQSPEPLPLTETPKLSSALMRAFKLKVGITLISEIIYWKMIYIHWTGNEKNPNLFDAPTFQLEDFGGRLVGDCLQLLRLNKFHHELPSSCFPLQNCTLQQTSDDGWSLHDHRSYLLWPWHVLSRTVNTHPQARIPGCCWADWSEYNTARPCFR